ncbi:MAG TPA: hypothetical protein PLH80_07870 [Spirochaetota bacterium]|nr:hypothetical protein [Spirochaetota bacterium]HOR94643.1 hypothetical protein [Spirochaetota bacterium]HPD04573.1 hypothetical protein [Spirochaetota bacterium]HPK46176.1 hypothetical protein [Spirochaetota bacterium]HQI38463.1 hypothetical protein [Spirochaetota bacterium]
MHEEITITQIIIASITAACAVALPIIFHLVGLGSLFLPMFIPLAIGSFFMTPFYACFTGAIAPITSSLLTGMPPLYPPIALLMVIELFFFCFIISVIIHRAPEVNAYIVMIIAIIVDRFVLYMLYALVFPYFHISFALLGVYDLLKSIPGIILLLMTVPPAVMGIKKLMKNYSWR